MSTKCIPDMDTETTTASQFTPCTWHPQTGDIVLFSTSANSITSRTIAIATRSEWTHIGIVVGSRVVPWQTQKDRVASYAKMFLFECVSERDSPMLDQLTGEMRCGVRVVDLSMRMQMAMSSKRCLALRRVTPRPPHLEKCIRELMVRCIGAGYMLHPMDAIKLMVGCSRDQDVKSWFCSELIGEALQSVGVLPRTPSAESYAPADFDTGGIAEQKVRNQGYMLSELFFVGSV